MQSVLLMARELLRYRLADNLYEDWLDRFVELINAAGEAPALSRLLPPAKPLAGDVAHDAPPPPPLWQDVFPSQGARPPSVTSRAGRPCAMKKAAG